LAGGGQLGEQVRETDLPSPAVVMVVVMVVVVMVVVVIGDW
jgi:hypothetical protein